MRYQSSTGVPNLGHSKSMNEFLPTLIALVILTFIVWRRIALFGKEEQALMWISFVAH